MRFPPHIKKILLLAIIILLGCDVSLLFAAPNDASQAATKPEIKQLRDQMQSQIQAQIKALQQSNPSLASQLEQANKSAINSPAAQSALQEQQSILNKGNNAAVVAASSGLPPQLNNSSADNMNPALQGFGSSQQNLQPSTNAGSLPVGATVAPQNPLTQSDQSNPAESQNVSSDDISEAAFNTMVQGALPMTPDQIQKLRSIYMASQFAASSTPGSPPKPTATSVFVDLSPGATPPIVRLAQGFVTSVVFIDSTGGAWPIEAYDVGNPSAFNIQWDKTSNTLMIQSTVLYTYGNLAVKLKGLDTPVMITLIPGQKAVDYRVDMRVQGVGPNARPVPGNGLPNAASSELMNILNGLPPSGSRLLAVEGENCQAWLSGNKLYIRTRLTVLSPGWVATLSSADGMHAYEMQPTPMLLVSQNGQVVQLKIEGF